MSQDPLPPPERPAQSRPRLEPSAAVSDDRRSLRRRLRLLPILATLAVAGVAAAAVWLLWQNYMESPWTRDGTVRAYVVTLAPEVSGRITELAVKDNQLVRKGDLLMKIDQSDYQLAVELGKAAVDQAQADFDNKKAEASRRLKLSSLATTTEEKQTYVASAKIWLLGYKQMLQGHVDSMAHGIVVSNVTPGKSGLATVNPVFTWVRLAQRVPVRVHIDDLPPTVRLVIGMTATIEVELKASEPAATSPIPHAYPPSNATEGRRQDPDNAGARKPRP